VDNVYSNIDKIDIIPYKLEDNQTERDFLIIFNPKSNLRSEQNYSESGKRQFSLI